jgi:hypothetical protein
LIETEIAGAALVGLAWLLSGTSAGGLRPSHRSSKGRCAVVLVVCAGGIPVVVWTCGCASRDAAGPGAGVVACGGAPGEGAAVGVAAAVGLAAAGVDCVVLGADCTVAAVCAGGVVVVVLSCGSAPLSRDGAGVAAGVLSCDGARVPLVSICRAPFFQHVAQTIAWTSALILKKDRRISAFGPSMGTSYRFLFFAFGLLTGRCLRGVTQFLAKHCTRGPLPPVKLDVLESGAEVSSEDSEPDSGS